MLVLILCVTGLLACFSCPATRAAASSDSTAHADRNWTITIPLWIPSYRGEFAIGDINVDGESSGGSGLSRLFDSELSLNFFFMGAFAYERDRWRVRGDVFGGKFTDDVIFKLTDGTVVSATVQPIIPSLNVSYRVLQHPWGDSGHQQVRLAFYGGLRYYDLKAETTVLNKATKVDASWIDPVLGVWIPVDLSQNWLAEMSADIGGFGVGSQLSWHIMATVSYQATALLFFTLGYNVLAVDYQDTIANQDFLYNVRVGGPLAGIHFNF